MRPFTRISVIPFALAVVCVAKGSSSSSKSSRSSGSSGHTDTKIVVWQSKPKAKTGGSGVSHVKKIKAGPRAGRTQGGGTRDEVLGSWWYGSGTPGNASLGVEGKNVDFTYLVVVYPQTKDRSGISYPRYIVSSSEYGPPDDASRPGGPLAFVNFTSMSAGGSTFSFLADNATILAMIPRINSSCASHGLLTSAPMTSTAYTNVSTYPTPEQAVQYYRGSSAVLTLADYNNTAIYASNVTLHATPLPTGTDAALLACLNSTITSDIPLYTQKGFTGSDVVGIAIGVLVALFILGSLFFDYGHAVWRLLWDCLLWLLDCPRRGWAALGKNWSCLHRERWRAYLRDTVRRRVGGARARPDARRPDGDVEAEKNLPVEHLAIPEPMASRHRRVSSVSMQPLLQPSSPLSSRSPSPIPYPPPPYHDSSRLSAAEPSPRYYGSFPSRSPSPSIHAGYDV